jgi:hypothetical protein
MDLVSCEDIVILSDQHGSCKLWGHCNCIWITMSAQLTRSMLIRYNYNVPTTYKVHADQIKLQCPHNLQGPCWSDQITMSAQLTRSMLIRYNYNVPTTYKVHADQIKLQCPHIVQAPCWSDTTTMSPQLTRSMLIADIVILSDQHGPCKLWGHCNCIWSAWTL